jgi:AbrB family looped-hinge helix DNA binding protein
MSTKLVRPINERNQITIPPELLRQLDVRPGDLMHLVLTNGGIVLQPVDVVERKAVAVMPQNHYTHVA